MNLLVLPRFDRLGASSRLRMLQFLPQLQAQGLHCRVNPLIDDELLRRKYAGAGYGTLTLLRAYLRRSIALLGRRGQELLWIEKEALPWLPAWLELTLMRRPYVLDFDDAIFHNYDRHGSAWVRRLFGRRVDKLMARAHLVVVGNEYLGDRARAAGARWVETLPTVVDLDRYPARAPRAPEDPGPLRIVWIGSPSTGQYLSLLAAPLASLATRHRFVLRVIGAHPVDLPGVPVEALPWSAETEAQAIGDCDIGVMPLFDSPWERGKCAYKLIQYMACGLPTVASAIGANVNVTVQGETGFLVSSATEWAVALERLIVDPALRDRLGAAGRNRVARDYSLQAVGPRLGELLKRAGEA
ncbi:Glycosyltransferase [Rubrivivax sp. A210]|uniref:glycosyltransferase family 4 protein n=1 Tax=Rubrivivax sp. A210 TaxID=2772301 RepID=UPI0019183505|nr:glycosyltransferase family 4 protein [Rubrivivax sp. A210]CAD5370703.1 Glycosyltransferase [Rubrivivax sp. A210]